MSQSLTANESGASRLNRSKVFSVPNPSQPLRAFAGVWEPDFRIERCVPGLREMTLLQLYLQEREATASARSSPAATRSDSTRNRSCAAYHPSLISVTHHFGGLVYQVSSNA
jgi:hypothetical protein